MYINEVLIVEIPADEPIQGTIGFGFGNDFVAGDYYAEIDNLVVRVLPEFETTPSPAP